MGANCVRRREKQTPREDQEKTKRRQLFKRRHLFKTSENNSPRQSSEFNRHCSLELQPSLLTRCPLELQPSLLTCCCPLGLSALATVLTQNLSSWALHQSQGSSQTGQVRCHFQRAHCRLGSRQAQLRSRPGRRQVRHPHEP